MSHRGIHFALLDEVWGTEDASYLAPRFSLCALQCAHIVSLPGHFFHVPNLHMFSIKINQQNQTKPKLTLHKSI